jgi:hypothetical protein
VEAKLTVEKNGQIEKTAFYVRRLKRNEGAERLGAPELRRRAVATGLGSEVVFMKDARVRRTAAEKPRDCPPAGAA